MEMTDSEIKRYLESLGAGAAHVPAAGPNGVPAAPGAAPAAVPVAAAGPLAMFGGLRPYVLPVVVGGSVYYLTENKWWALGLSAAALLLQGSFQVAPPPPPPAPVAG